MVAAVIVEITQVDQSVAQAALVADVAPNLQSFLEIGQGILVLAQQSLVLAISFRLSAIPRFCPMLAPDGQCFLVVAQSLFGLVQHPISATPCSAGWQPFVPDYPVEQRG